MCSQLVPLCVSMTNVQCKICKSGCSKVQGAMCKCMFFRTAIYCTLHYTVNLMLCVFMLPVVSMHLHALKYAVSCLVLCTKTHILTVSLMHSHYLQHGDLFSGCYELGGCMPWMLLVMWSSVAVLSVLTV